MVDKSVKYYEGSLNPLPEWTKNDGTKTVFKSIRITEEENQNWKPETIHEFLSGENKSNDSIRINKLKQVLRVYDLLFRENMNVIMENDKMSQFILDHDDFNLIGEVL